MNRFGFALSINYVAGISSHWIFFFGWDLLGLDLLSCVHVSLSSLICLYGLSYYGPPLLKFIGTEFVELLACIFLKFNLSLSMV